MKRGRTHIGRSHGAVYKATLKAKQFAHLPFAEREKFARFAHQLSKVVGKVNQLRDVASLAASPVERVAAIEEGKRLLAEIRAKAAEVQMPGLSLEDAERVEVMFASLEAKERAAGNYLRAAQVAAMTPGAIR